jgi:ABC-type nickel/cobalt efflux system permease component RcnA
MNIAPQFLLVGAVGSVGVLHTIVPDHWFPITVMARQRGWSKSETARVALKAGTGHVVSTLVIAMLVWVAGAAAARRFGSALDTATSLALVGFGLWIAVSACIAQHHKHAHPDRHGSHAPGHEHHEGGSGHSPPHGQKSRTALMLILGSSPMVEGIPAFFAAGKYGLPLIVAMSLVFAVSTILTYVVLCVFSTAGLRRIRFEAFERQGEILSGVVIALVGLAFWHWPFR